MSTPKEHVLEFVRGLPDDVSFEDIERELIEDLRYKRDIQLMVERAREQKRDGQMISHSVTVADDQTTVP